MRINHANKQIDLKLVFAGGPGSGKTSNLEYLYHNAEQALGDGLESIRDSNDQTLLFDFAPFECEKVDDYDVHFQVFTLPGKTIIEMPQEMGFSGMDGMVLVIDSRWEALEEMVAYYEWLRGALVQNEIDMTLLPHVLQYNKRDEPDVAPVHYLELVFNKFGAPHFEASSINGTGVFDTLNGLARIVLDRVMRNVIHRLENLPEFSRVW